MSDVPRGPQAVVSRPDISEKDWEAANATHRILTKEEREVDRPGEGQLDRFARISSEAQTYSDVNYRVQEAIDINQARDTAERFGLEPSLADDDLVFRRDLKIAVQILDELGLDGKQVYSNEDQRRALQQLIASEVRVGGHEGRVMRAKAAVELAQQKLDNEQALLERELQANASSEEELVRLAGRNESDSASSPSANSPVKDNPNSEPDV